MTMICGMRPGPLRSQDGVPILAAGVLLVVACGSPLVAQEPPRASRPGAPSAASQRSSPQETPASQPAPQTATAPDRGDEAPTTLVAPVSADQVATITYQNRPISTLRARVLNRMPAERAATAVRMLDDAVADGVSGPVTTRVVQNILFVRVGNRDVFTLLRADVDELGGETLEGRGADAAERLRQALAEAVELRTPGRLLRAVLAAAAVTVLLVLILWVIRRGYRRVSGWLVDAAERQLQRVPGGDLSLVRASRLLDLSQRAVTLAALLVSLIFVYGWLAFTLRRFPYTRPWGESLRQHLLDTVGSLGIGLLHAIPGLFTVLLIFLITRFFVRLSGLFFEAVEQGRVVMPAFYPETAQPTRRLISALLWVFAIVVAYPYLPGSGTDAFKGVSVFVGLVISLGSSGLVNQIMSSFMITYSRALRLGDFVRLGEVEGTVTHLGLLSTKIKTPRREEVTFPNAVVASNTMTNYSRYAETDGVYAPTSVTIGYDTPWRQVHAMLLLAAERAPGIRRDPKATVMQTRLQDFYVEYTLLVCLERPDRRVPTLAGLHAEILDVFNEHGVQIMSPNYEADPAAPKLVPRERWYEAPANPTANT